MESWEEADPSVKGVWRSESLPCEKVIHMEKTIFESEIKDG